MIPFIAWESTAPGAKKKKSNLRLKTVAGYVFLFAAMSCEIKLNNLQGGVITLDIPITATVRELKAMLLAKHPCQDPIERKILKVELLRDSSIIDDAETLDAAGFFCAESLVTVAYTRNEVEAATKDEIDDIHAQRCFGAKIPCNLTEISRYAFQNCRQLVLVSIEGSVTHIGAGAFAQCRSLTSISMGESVTHIGEQAFVGCRSLPSISMGESVRHIGDFAFAQCTSLTSISMGESVMHIGAFAFAQCTSLTSISMGESVTHIGAGAFWQCTSLTSITLPESLRHISEQLKAESGSRSLKIITIPSTQGRKRQRSEWGSVQICHDGNGSTSEEKRQCFFFPHCSLQPWWQQLGWLRQTIGIGTWYLDIYIYISIDIYNTYMICVYIYIHTYIYHDSTG